MTPVETGGAGNPPPSIPQREINEATSAWVENAKSTLGLVPNNADISLILRPEQRMPYERFQAAGNKSTSMPTLQMREPASAEVPDDTSWMALTSEIRDRLPPDIRQRYDKQMALPFQQRSMAFAALDIIVDKLAMALNWVNNVQVEPPLESLAHDHLQLNLSLPLIALAGTITHTREVVTAASRFLNNVGPNYPHHDALRPYIQDIGAAVNALQGIVDKMRSGEPTAAIQAQLQHLNSQITNLNSRFQRMWMGDDLRILNPALQMMELTATALSLTNASPSLFLGLSLAHVGLDSSRSDNAALFGNAFSRITKAFADGPLALYAPKATAAERQFWQLLTTTTFTAAAAFSAITASNGIGILPGDGDKAQEGARNYSFDLMLHAFFASGVANGVFASAAKSINADEKGQKGLEAAGNAALASVMILSAAHGRPLAAEKLFDSMLAFLLPHLQRTSDDVSEALMEGDLGEGAAHNASIALQQMKLALQRGDSDSFAAAIENLFNLLNTGSSEFNSDASKLEHTAVLVRDAAQRKGDDTPLTNVSFAA